MRVFLILIMTPLAAFALDLTDQQRADIEARIQPFSAVCVQGEACGGGDSVAENAARSGEDVYNGACMACHTLVNKELKKIAEEVTKLGEKVTDDIIKRKLDEVSKSIKPLKKTDKVTDTHLIN